MRVSLASLTSTSSFTSPTLDDGGGDDDDDENDVMITRRYTQATFSDAIVQERQREVQEVHSKMGTVHAVFNDLSNLVEEQQVEIDDIEQNIARSREAAGRGMGQLEKGSEVSKRESTMFKDRKRVSLTPHLPLRSSRENQANASVGSSRSSSSPPPYA